VRTRPDGGVDFKLGNLNVSKDEATFKRLLTEGNMQISTPYYRAPESSITTKADVYSATVVLAELVLKHVKVRE
jgi:hypothetical protein